MTQPASGFVDVLSRDGGKLLSQSQSHTSRIVRLDQPSLVKIHAPTPSVVDTQQQGDDLILHMRDGSTVRYQHFFTATDGEQSELLFDDGVNPPQRALFSSGLNTTDAAVPLTPTYQALASVDALLSTPPAVESGGTMTTAGLGLLGLAGVGGGVALASHHSRSDDSSRQTAASGGDTPAIVDTRDPQITMNEISGNDVIDASEKSDDLLIEGTAWNEVGQTVEVIFNDQAWHTVVNSSGTWSLVIPASALQGLHDGVYHVQASLTDAAGNSTSIAHDITLATSPETLPSLAIDPISTDDAVSYREGIYGLEMSGTSSNLPSGTVITLDVAGKTYTGGVESGGIWHVSISDSELAAIIDAKYLFTFSATDPNGHSTSATRDVLLLSHYTSKIGFTVDDVCPADVSVVDGQEYVTIGGTFADTFPIHLISIRVDDYPYYDATLTEDHHWSIRVPLSGSNVHDGVNNIYFGTSDGAGNWVEQVDQIHVDLESATNSHSLQLASLGLAAKSDAMLAAPTQDDLSVVQSLALAGDTPVTLTSPEGGVWPQGVPTASGHASEVYHAPLQENTLADVLTQHQLQLLTV